MKTLTPKLKNTLNNLTGQIERSPDFCTEKSNLIYAAIAVRDTLRNRINF